MLKNYLDNVRKKRPIIHSITNYVTINDVANVLHASGAKPVMSDSYIDIDEITLGADGLYMNMGMLSPEKLETMLMAGSASNRAGHVTVLDPVGAGSSRFRNESARKLISNVHFDAIRGNYSEIMSLYAFNRSRGVDSGENEVLDEENFAVTVRVMKQIAKQTGTVVIMSGETDLVTDGSVVCSISNGSSMMRRVTGSGCMLSSLVTAFITANPDSAFEASVYAVIMMNIAGEKALYRMNETGGGNITFRNAMIDSVFALTHEEIERQADYEVFR